MANEYLLNIAVTMQAEAAKIKALALADDDTGDAVADLIRDWAEITRAELGVFKWVALGLTTKEIAHLQGISPRSVDTLRYSLQEKIRAKNTSHAVSLLHQAKLLR